MRRKDKQITDKSIIEDILHTNTVYRVGFYDGDYPYIIPMNYGYKDNTIYLHSALEGKKIELLQRNNKVCLEVTDSIEILTSEKACNCSTKYRSVICYGTISLVQNFEQKVEGLTVLINQHKGENNRELPKAVVENVLVLKIHIETITGKSSGFN